MPPLPSVSGIRVVRALERHDFKVTRVSGSHHIMRHPDGRGTTVPVHGNRDVAKGTLRGNLNDVGMTNRSERAATGLESVFGATPREFESRILRPAGQPRRHVVGPCCGSRAGGVVSVAAHRRVTSRSNTPSILSVTIRSCVVAPYPCVGGCSSGPPSYSPTRSGRSAAATPRGTHAGPRRCHRQETGSPEGHECSRMLRFHPRGL